jgi:hypothetical protein
LEQLLTHGILTGHAWEEEVDRSGDKGDDEELEKSFEEVAESHDKSWESGLEIWKDAPCTTARHHLDWRRVQLWRAMNRRCGWNTPV